MAYNYYGDNGKDTVKQNYNHPYYNIYTYGGQDSISLTLTNTYVVAGSGNDTVSSTAEGFNDVYLGDGDDSYTGLGFSTKGNRYDIVYGEAGNDTFHVETSHSEYYGNGAKDTFYSIGLNNYFDGGNGTDTVSYKIQDDDPVLQGIGVYVDLEDKYADTGSARQETLINIENAEGTSYNDTLIGGDGDNKLSGLNGADVLKGKDGEDRLIGSKGNDDLYGGNDMDKLIGGKGFDIMEGGGAGDTFIFESVTDSAIGSKRDVITDFGAGDLLDMSSIDAVAGGADDAFTFIGSAKFTGAAGELRFANHILYADIDGDRTADMQIKLDDVGSLSKSDFIL
jgi:Ca2+-binding RTX toxin-like protein